MAIRRLALAALCALLLAAPAAAFAQGAGDQQYQDPLGTDTTSGSGGHSSGSGSSGGGSSAGTSTPAPTPSHTTAAATSSHTAHAAASGELPRTGGEPFIVAYLGAAMLAIGAGMRLAVPRRR